MLIGWMQDTHTHTDLNATEPGAQQEFVDDYDYLVNNVGVSTLYHGGDVVHADEPDEAVPHADPSAFERFFELASQTTDGGDTLARLVPGNHDVPLSTFLAADDRCVLRDRIDYPGDDLTVLFVNTQATGIVTGSPGDGDQGGVGTEVCRVAADDVRWLDAQLGDADALGHAVLLVPHAALTPIPSASYSRVNGYNGQLDGNSLYNIVVNHDEVHGVLADHAAGTGGLDIVVPVSHLYQFDGEGSETIDNVHYAYKNHYWRGSEFETFAYIDMTGASATVTIVDHDTRSETVVLDVTF